MRKWVVVFISAFVLSLANVLPAGAAILSHDLKIINVGSKPMRVGKHWSFSHSTSSNPNDLFSEGSCRLRKGESSRGVCNWRDADGVKVPAGYSLMIPQWGTDHALRGCRATTFYAKVSPTLWSSTKKLYLKKCSKY